MSSYFNYIKKGFISPSFADFCAKKLQKKDFFFLQLN